MLDKSNQGVSLKLSTLFDDVAPEKEIQSFISVEVMRQGISKSLIPLGQSRCFDTVENHLKNMQKNRDFNDTISSNVARDNSPLGLSVMNSPPSSCKKLNKRTNYGTTKHQGFCSKRHFSFSPRDKSHLDVFLPLIIRDCTSGGSFISSPKRAHVRFSQQPDPALCARPAPHHLTGVPPKGVHLSSSYIGLSRLLH